MKGRHKALSLAAAIFIGTGIVSWMGANVTEVRAAETAGVQTGVTDIDREAQKKLDSAMGKMVMVEWNRVKSAEDLRACTAWTPMRLYYDFHSQYNQQMQKKPSDISKQDFYNKGYLILDDSGTSHDRLTLDREEIPSYIYTNDDFTELYAVGQNRYGYIQYSGQNDKDNDGMPMCKISLNPSRTGYLDVNSKANLETNESWQDNWTVYPVSNGSQNLVKLFVNLKNASDPTVRVQVDNKTGSGVFYSDTKGYLSGYEEYTMYIGKTTDVTVIQRNITVGDGQTVRINRSGAVALQAGVTLTIEEGGAAIIQSRFLNQGTIINHGTLIVMDGGSLQPIYDPGAGSILCDGGDIVIMKGGRFMSSEELTLQNGSSIVNQGIFLMKKSLTLDNSALITEDGGCTLLGYDIKPAGFASAAKTTAYDSETGKSGPALAGSSFYSRNSASCNLKNGARMINRGETSIHQAISSGKGCTIRRDGGTLYDWN